MFGYIYRIHNTLNDKNYIGLTTRDVKERFNEHCVANSYIGRSIRKYGAENFKVFILDEAINPDELSDKEIYWIGKYNSYENGYNLTLGGEGPKRRSKYYIDVQLTQKQLDFIEMREEVCKYPYLSITTPYEFVIHLVHHYLVCDDIRYKEKFLKLIKNLRKDLYLLAKTFDVIEELD